jgi:hypothetical protein
VRQLEARVLDLPVADANAWLCPTLAQRKVSGSLSIAWRRSAAEPGSHTRWRKNRLGSIGRKTDGSTRMQCFPLMPLMAPGPRRAVTPPESEGKFHSIKPSCCEIGTRLVKGTAVIGLGRVNISTEIPGRIVSPAVSSLVPVHPGIAACRRREKESRPLSGVKERCVIGRTRKGQ